MAETKSTSLVQEVRKNLGQLQQHVMLAQASVAVAVRALKHQDAEQDHDIACVLEHCVGDQLARQIECMDVLIAKLGQSEMAGEYRVEQALAPYGVQ